MSIVARLALGLALLATPAMQDMATHAIAASPADVARQDDRSDEIQDQEDAIDAAQNMDQARQAAGQEVPSAPKEFNFRINAPFYYTSNATLVQSGEPAALELDPEIELGWTRSLTSVPLKLSVRLKADTDRYINVPQADGNEASGSFKAAYYDVNNDQAWAPFISYRGTGEYDSTFSPRTEERNDFALGFDKFLYFGSDFHLLPASARSRVTAVWSLGFSLYVQRRLREPGPDSYATYVVPSVTYVASRELTMSLFLNVRERWFDSVTSSTTTPLRRDFEIEPIVTLAYNPSEGLFARGRGSQRQLLGSPQIALQIGRASCRERVSNCV